ncbi:MAG TPA: hypothetical protein VG966_13440 [Hyphomicrobiaceae bacterium]|nr:hypothetical protein [Hyphomicrobiaceae bacterium]
MLAAASAAIWTASEIASGSWTSAAAQQPRALINVAPVMLVEPASKAPLPIQVGPYDAPLKNSFLRIRGLPPAAALSEGHAISPGAWAVPLVGLPSLAVVLPVGLEGRWNVTIALVNLEGTVLAEAKTVLIVGPAQLIATPQTGQDTQQTNVASLGTAAPPPPSPEQQKALGLHAKGQELLERGNIYPARMFFKRAAEAGLAQSALALAATYDPNELAKLKVVGLQPDVAAARHWYQKALELGAEEAKVRLRRLEDR